MQHSGQAQDAVEPSADQGESGDDVESLAMAIQVAQRAANFSM